MSTKIYEAYRLRKPSQFWPFVHSLRARGIKDVRDSLRTLYANLAMNAVNQKSKGYQEAMARKKQWSGIPEDKLDRLVRIDMAHDLVLKDMVEHAGKSTRGLFDLDVSISFFEHQGQVYMIPWRGDNVKDVLTRKALLQGGRLEDFSYWDNVDPDPKVSPQEWSRRGRIWGKILDSQWGFGIRLVLYEWGINHFVDPYIADMIEETKKEKGVLTDQSSPVTLSPKKGGTRLEAS